MQSDGARSKKGRQLRRYIIDNNCEPFSDDCAQECQFYKPKFTKRIFSFLRHLRRSLLVMAQLPYANLGHPAKMGKAPCGGYGRRLLSLTVTFALIFAIYEVYRLGEELRNRTTIIIITPTHRRPERLADMTRFSQTLMHVSDLHWIVVEDSNQTKPAVERILKRSKLPYTYFYTTSMPGFPKRGWTHRNMALDYIRNNYRNYAYNAVVYFADDDNSYDIRLFDEHVRKVKTIGLWAVGLAGGAVVEAPYVVDGVIKKWDVMYAPTRKFATDMAGFAVNLNLILSTNASFHFGCVKQAPESCFLSQFGIPANKMEPFGWNAQPKEILVWHTKTKTVPTLGSSHGYVAEV